MSEHLIAREMIASFVKGGKALFTIENTKTGGRFTYKVRKADDENREFYFVSVLSGQNNDSDYAYIGCIFESTFKYTRKSRVSEDAPSFKAFAWFNEKINTGTLPECVNVYHHNRCGRCGRTLTVPESIVMGIGPECASRMGV